MSDRQGTLLLGALAVGSIIFWMSQKKMSKIVTRKGEKERNSGGAIEGTKEVFNTTSTKVLFATKTGTARLFALELERLLRDGTLEGEEVEVLEEEEVEEVLNTEDILKRKHVKLSSRSGVVKIPAKGKARAPQVNESLPSRLADDLEQAELDEQIESINERLLMNQVS